MYRLKGWAVLGLLSAVTLASCDTGEVAAPSPSPSRAELNLQSEDELSVLHQFAEQIRLAILNGTGPASSSSISSGAGRLGTLAEGVRASMNTGDASPFSGYVTLCKIGPVGTTATFDIAPTGETVTVNAQELENLDARQCRLVWAANSSADGTVNVTITEHAQAGMELYSIVAFQSTAEGTTLYESIDNPTSYSYTIPVSGAVGATVYFKNRPVEVPANPAISIIKKTNGTDNNSPTGPVILVDATVNWTYEVTNTGDVPLSDVTVTDDRGVAVSCPKNTLAVAESMTCTGTGTAVPGQYRNVGTATGTHNGTTVTAQDPDHYFGLVPTGKIGDYVWRDNNGNGLQNAGEPGIPGVEVRLLQDGITVATTITDASGNYLFTGLVAGCYSVVVGTPSGMMPSPSGAGSDRAIDSNGSPAPVCLPTHSSVDLTIDFGFVPITPGIQLVKLTNGTDNNTPTGPVVPVGSTVTWTYNVTNTGNVPLTDVTVTDNRVAPSAINCGTDSNVIPSLAVGMSAACTATGTATAGQYTNTGTAVGTGGGTTVTSSDPDHYFGRLVGGQGCTPGYWKQKQHFANWTSPYTPTTAFSAVFANAFPGKTLLDVLNLGGGGLNALGRHAVAALLNAAHSGVSYNLSTADVISAFNAAVADGNIESTKNGFERFNEQGCPLGR